MIVIGIWWSSPVVTHPPNKSHFQLAQQALNACRLQDAIEEANKVTNPDLQEKATLIIETANEGIEECNKYKFVEIKLDKDRTWLYNPIKEAKKEAEKIKTTCWQKKANEKIEEYNRDEELYKLAQQSLNQRRWNDAIKAANQINNSYWKNKSTQILQIANQELEARYQGLFFVLTSLVLLVLGFVLFPQVILIGCLIIVVFIIIVAVFITAISFGVGV
jgi:hypothetical protein